MMQRHMPMGYRMKDGIIQADKEKGQIIKILFGEYLLGTSTYQLAKNLTKMKFLNANGKPSWSHSSVGRILENTKYLGDGYHPQIIDKELFDKVQIRRESQCKKLGRQMQKQEMKNKKSENPLSGILRCGKCGELFHKYTEHCGKPTEKSIWRCRQYSKKDRINCGNGVITTEQIEETFLDAVRKIVENNRLLEANRKEIPYHFSLAYRNIQQQIVEAEESGKYGQELAHLLYQRAMEAYQTTEIKDHSHNVEVMKVAFAEGAIQTFDTQFFQRIVKIMTIYEDEHTQIEFINGVTIEGTYENKSRKRGRTDADNKDMANANTTNTNIRITNTGIHRST